MKDYIYLDWNVYKYLKKPREEERDKAGHDADLKLKPLVQRLSTKYIFPYSEGHIKDVANKYTPDKRDYVVSDLTFAESINHQECIGSVTTLALDFAIRAGAVKVVMMGCDLAYTGGASHAAGTIDQRKNVETGTVEVKGFYGDTVKTNPAYSLYREWIERRITQKDAEKNFIHKCDRGWSLYKWNESFIIAGSVFEKVISMKVHLMEL
jgi:hypothetical protein